MKTRTKDIIGSERRCHCYSTGTQPEAMRANLDNEPKTIFDSEVEVCAETEECTSWCYLFVHHAKVNSLSKKLQEEQFRTFVHKRIIFTRRHKQIKKEEKASVSGLVFIQGETCRIQTFLKENFFNIYLVKDCSTGRVAVIPDSVMQPFMRMSEVNPTRIRFMPHTFGYYSVGNPLVRITSGTLAGLEGYRIRISRDKCLVTSIGGMTVAIGGIYKENFENLDEYVGMRRQQLKNNRESSDVVFTSIQQDIDNSFFEPQNQLDIMAIADGLTSWLERMKDAKATKRFDDAVEIALFLLEEIGYYFRNVYYDPHIGDMKEVFEMGEKADAMLLDVVKSVDVAVDLKEIVITGRESLALRYPFLPIEV